MLVASIIAAVVALLLGLHVRVIRRHRVAGAYEPAAALWLAARLGPLPPPAPAGPRLADRERRAMDRLLTGDLEPSGYRLLMARLAAQEARERPLRVPSG